MEAKSDGRGRIGHIRLRSPGNDGGRGELERAKAKGAGIAGTGGGVICSMGDKCDDELRRRRRLKNFGFDMIGFSEGTKMLVSVEGVTEISEAGFEREGVLRGRMGGFIESRANESSARWGIDARGRRFAIEFD